MNRTPHTRSAAVLAAAIALAPAAALAAALGGVLSASPAFCAGVTLPPITRTTLKNGLTVIVLPTHRLPLVDFLLQVRTGSVADPPGREGLAGLTGDLLTQGAGRRSARQIAEDIAFVGGELAAESGEERLSVSCEVLKRDFAVGLELLRDVVVSPSFSREEFERRKSEALGAIASAKDDPDATAERELLPFLMGSHPLAHPVLGWDESVRKLTREDVVSFHRRHFTPDNAMLAVVGDVDPKAVVAALEAAFKEWRSPGESREPAYPPLAGVPRREVLLLSRPEATQSQIRMACPAVARNHPDFFPILVTNAILSGGFTSRLVNEIRVAQGLTYGISSRFRMQRGAGQFVISTFTRNETLRKTLDEVIKVVQALRTDGPTEEELVRAQRYLAGQFPRGLQAPDDLAAQLLNAEFYRLEPEYLQTFTARLAAVTLVDCRRALKSYFCTDDLKLLVVTQPELGKTALEGLGPVRVKNPR
ncbi:MAG: pitrilysin family protein [Candidatus Eisenbacteria bacterium]